MALTNATFLAAVQALTVTGAKRHYDEPPLKLQTAELPAVFPLMPGGGLGEKTVSCWNTNKTRRISLVLAFEPKGQGTQAQNYGKIAGHMDNLEAAIDGLERSQNGSLANFIEYDIEAGFIEVGGIEYWCIVAEIQARDI